MYKNSVEVMMMAELFVRPELNITAWQFVYRWSWRRDELTLSCPYPGE